MDPKYLWGERAWRTEFRQYYSSFFLNGAEIRKNGCVFLLNDNPGDPPYIAKLKELWEELGTGKLQARVRWFFRPEELVLPSTDCEINLMYDNEVFLAGGNGRGAENTNDLGAIAGRATVLCLENHWQNPCPTVSDIRQADAVFRKIYDIDSLCLRPVSDALSILPAEILFNKPDWVSHPPLTQIQSTVTREAVVQAQELESRQEKAPMEEQGDSLEAMDIESQTNGSRPKELVPTNGEEGGYYDVLTEYLESQMPDKKRLKTGKEPLAQNPDRLARVKEKLAQVAGIVPPQNTQQSEAVKSGTALASSKRVGVGESSIALKTSKNPETIDTGAGNSKALRGEGPGIDRKREQNLSNMGNSVTAEAPGSKGKETVQKKTIVSKNTNYVSKLMGRASSFGGGSKQTKGLILEGNLSQKVISTANESGEEEPVDGNKKGPVSHKVKDRNNEITKPVSVPRTSNVEWDSKSVKAEGTRDGKRKLTGSDSFQSKQIERHTDGSGHSKGRLEKQGMDAKIESKWGKKASEDVMKKGKALSVPERNGSVVSNERLSTKGERQSTSGHESGRKSSSFQVTSGVGEKPQMDSNFVFKFTWEKAFPRALQQKRVLLLQNLDPSLTSAELQEALKSVLPLVLQVKVVQQATSCRINLGRALVVMDTQDAAENALSLLCEKILVFGEDSRPVVASLAKLPEESRASQPFPGHFDIEKTSGFRGLHSHDYRKAVACSHSSQPNTMEHFMAVDWRVLQLRQKHEMECLAKIQAEEVKALLTSQNATPLKAKK